MADKVPLPPTHYVIGIEGDGYSEDRCTTMPAWDDDQMRSHAAAVSAADNAVLRAENEALKLQAQCWKFEAKAQKATVHESYQAITRATGEPGDWNGANPVRARIKVLLEVVESAAAADQYLENPEAIFRLARMARAALEKP